MNDSCKCLVLDGAYVQENGIIRNKDGYLIGRLSNDIDFNSEHIQTFAKPDKHICSKCEEEVSPFDDDHYQVCKGMRRPDVEKVIEDFMEKFGNHHCVAVGDCIDWLRQTLEGDKK